MASGFGSHGDAALAPVVDAVFLSRRGLNSPAAHCWVEALRPYHRIPEGRLRLPHPEPSPKDSIVPTGTSITVFHRFPAINRWALVKRPSGTFARRPGRVEGLTSP